MESYVFTLIAHDEDTDEITLLGTFTDSEDAETTRRWLNTRGVDCYLEENVINPTAFRALEAYTDDPENWLADFAPEEG